MIVKNDENKNGPIYARPLECLCERISHKFIKTFLLSLSAIFQFPFERKKKKRPRKIITYNFPTGSGSGYKSKINNCRWKVNKKTF